LDYKQIKTKILSKTKQYHLLTQVTMMQKTRHKLKVFLPIIKKPKR